MGWRWLIKPSDSRQAQTLTYWPHATPCCLCHGRYSLQKFLTTLHAEDIKLEVTIYLKPNMPLSSISNVCTFTGIVANLSLTGYSAGLLLFSRRRAMLKLDASHSVLMDFERTVNLPSAFNRQSESLSHYLTEWSMRSTVCSVIVNYRNHGWF